MMKKRMISSLLVVWLIFAGAAALAETRETVIEREGEAETVTETLFESPQGFSFWYADEWLEAYEGTMYDIDGAIVESRYSDDGMVLSAMPAEDAEEYIEGITSADARVQEDVYREPEDGMILFCTVIADQGQYVLAVGEYAEEAAEGNGVLLQRVLDSVATSASSQDAAAIRAEWRNEAAGQILLTALSPVSDVVLLHLNWGYMNADGVPDITWTPYAPLGSLSEGQSVAVTLAFIGDMPDNGLMYTDADGASHAFALDISGEDGHLYLWPLDAAQPE